MRSLRDAARVPMLRPSRRARLGRMRFVVLRRRAARRTPEISPGDRPERRAAAAGESARRRQAAFQHRVLSRHPGRRERQASAPSGSKSSRSRPRPRRIIISRSRAASTPESHGCLHGEFRLAPDRAPRTRYGIFADGQPNRPVWVRYSNGVGWKQADDTLDARGMAVKVMDVPGPKYMDEKLTPRLLR